MKFDELYKKVIDSCRAFEERQVPIRLDFKIEDFRDALVESNDTIEKLKQKLEDAKATAYAESVDAGMRERRLKRALWLGREWRAWCEGEFWLAVESDEPGDIYHLKCTNRIHRTPYEWTAYWHKVEQLCKKKAEEYK